MRLIGTSGHVDHGKSALVHALTGVHPSRLPEEHARGMTIDLGYAHLDHPDGFRLGIVDVPGHERLVKNMVAGATGFALALWAVDAREGIMPQSREHLSVLELLGTRVVIPVITKADVATSDEIDATRRAVAAMVAGRDFLALPVHVIDSISGAGITALRESIFAATRERDEGDDASDDPWPYLPIDRVFSVKGAGVVVTGTLARGTLREGEHVAVTSQPGTWRVRSLTNHRARVASTGAGARAGVNLVGLAPNAVRRGDVLVAPDHPYHARAVNVLLRRTPEAPNAWRHGARLLFHAGCLEMECQLWDATGDGGAGDAVYAQLTLARESCFFPGQRFILRSASPLVTVAGGTVLDLAPDRPRRVTPAERAAYAARVNGVPRLTAYVAAGGAPVCDLAATARRWMAPELALRADAAGEPSLRTSDAATEPRLAWTADVERALLDRLRALALETAAPRERVVPYDALARDLRLTRTYARPLVRAVLVRDAAAALPPLRLDGAGVVLHPGRSDLTADEQTLADALLARLRAEWLRPSTVEVCRAAFATPPGAIDRVIATLAAARRVVRIPAARGDLLLHGDAADALRDAPAAHVADGVRASEFGQALGVSRKYGVAYLEWLGRERLMRRVGDRHYRVA